MQRVRRRASLQFAPAARSRCTAKPQPRCAHPADEKMSTRTPSSGLLRAHALRCASGCIPLLLGLALVCCAPDFDSLSRGPAGGAGGGASSGGAAGQLAGVGGAAGTAQAGSAASVGGSAGNAATGGGQSGASMVGAAGEAGAGALDPCVLS